MASPLDRNTLVSHDIEEPYGSFLEWLADLWEQADMQREGCSDPTLIQIIDELQARIVGLGLIVHVAATRPGAASGQP